MLEERLKKVCAPRGVTVKLTVVREIDYLSVDTVPGGKADETVRLIKHALLRVCSDSIWMVHNYHLGKNPLFTRALLEIAREHQGERFCFYIHDFPESSRYENLSFLRRFVPESPYPISANVRYAVINGRDLKYLTSAGIPDSMVFLLNNPVPQEELPHGDTHRLRTHLEKCVGDEFPAYDPNAPLLIYPVRAIRRKNVLEMGLICATSPVPVNLVVTLPGTSQTEKTYSGTVTAAFTAGLIPGIWGAGTRLDDAGITFPELLSMADVICSSSVQEGFGYLFINAVVWGIPLFARYLDVLDGIIDVFNDHRCHFYRSIRVPAIPGKTAIIKAAYEEKAHRLETLVGEEIENSIAKQFASVIGDDAFEFSFLPLEDQFTTLKKVNTDTGYRDAVRDLNAGTLNALGKLCSAAASTGPNGTVAGIDTKKDEWPFTFERYAATVQAIIDSFEIPSAAETTYDVQAALIKQFATIEYSRLLYGN